MNEKTQSYGKLCSLFYDATKAYAPQAEIEFYSRFIRQYPGRVLEAMSGSGRLQIPLIQQGFVVDGVDNSPSMLAHCRERCNSLGIKAHIYEQALEELALPHHYTTITIAVGSFQLINDSKVALQALKKLHSHLVKGGRLLLDIFTPDIEQPERSVRYAQLDQKTRIRLTTRHSFDFETKNALSFCLYELLVNGLVQEQENELMEIIWYSDEEWHALLTQAGFTLLAFHDTTFRASGPSRVIEAQA